MINKFHVIAINNEAVSLKKDGYHFFLSRKAFDEHLKNKTLEASFKEMVKVFEHALGKERINLC